MATPNPLLRSPGNNIHKNILDTLIAHYKLNEIKNNNSIAFLRKRLESGNLAGRIIFNIPGYGNLQVRVKNNKAKANANRARARPTQNPIARINANRRRPKTPRGFGRILQPVASAAGKMAMALSGFR